MQTTLLSHTPFQEAE